jgi:hypothetical protein
MLEALASIDLAGLGQDLGNAIAFGLTVITSGNLGNILSAQLKLSGAQFINTLIQGFFGLISAISTAFSQIPENFVTILGIVTKADFWAGVGLGLLSAAQKFAAVINGAAATLLEALAKVPGLGAVGGLASGFRDTQASLEASSAQNASASSMNLEGALAALRDRMAQNFDEIIANVSTTMEGIGETIDTTELQAARDGLVGEITTQMEANREAVRSRFEATKTQTPLMEDMEGQAGKSNTGIIAQSLQKVGGGAAFARFSDAANPAAEAVREQKKSNGYLQTIAEGINYIRSGNGGLMPA